MTPRSSYPQVSPGLEGWEALTTPVSPALTSGCPGGTEPGAEVELSAKWVEDAGALGTRKGRDGRERKGKG